MKKLFIFLFGMLLISYFTFGSSITGHRYHSNTGKDKNRPSGFGKDQVSFLQNEASELKSALSGKQRLDSLIQEKYDETTGQWKKFSKLVFTYDAQLNGIQDIGYHWNETTLQWVNSWKKEYVFDDDNRTQEVFYNWDEITKQWVCNWKQEFTYDTQRNLKQYFFYDLDETTRQPIYSWKDEYFYDTDGTITCDISYEMDGPANLWIASHKSEYTYDAGGNKVQDISYNFDETSRQWVNAWKTEYVSDANKNIIQEIYSKFTLSTGQWANYTKKEYSYDINKNLSSERISQFDTIFASWIPDHITECGYSNGTRISDQAYNRDRNNGIWVPYRTNNYTYDNTYVSENLILPVDYAGSNFFQKQLTQQVEYGYMNDRQIPVTKYQFYYSIQFPTSTNELYATGHISVFPNPTTNTVTFTTEEISDQLILELRDVQGKMVMNQIIENKTPVSVGNLPKGLYFYRVSGGSKQAYLGKLIVE